MDIALVIRKGSHFCFPVELLRLSFLTFTILFYFLLSKSLENYFLLNMNVVFEIYDCVVVNLYF